MKTMFLIVLTAILIINSCEKEVINNIFIEKYQKIYGKWKPVSIKGGKSGNEETPDFQYLSFEKSNVFKVLADQTICSGIVNIFKQTNDTLIIELIPKSGNHLLALPCHKFTSFSGDTLILDEIIDCTDSYQYKFINEN